MTSQLQRLDNQPVRVDVSWAGITRVFRGRGKYSTDEQLGPVLGIAIDDPAGNFEFLIPDETWSGEILEDATVEDGYRIRLDSPPVAVGTALTGRPPHRSVRAALPHTAPTLGVFGEKADSRSDSSASPRFGAPLDPF